jgi:hypothetical protein
LLKTLCGVGGGHLCGNFELQRTPTLMHCSVGRKKWNLFIAIDFNASDICGYGSNEATIQHTPAHPIPKPKSLAKKIFKLKILLKLLRL